MLTCFNLQDGQKIEGFCAAIADFTGHMQGEDLVESVSPVGRRQTDTIMDTDAARSGALGILLSHPALHELHHRGLILRVIP